MAAIEEQVQAVPIERVMERISAEDRETPSLALTSHQTERVWGCDSAACRCLNDVLVQRRLLQWSRDGRLICPSWDKGNNPFRRHG